MATAKRSKPAEPADDEDKPAKFKKLGAPTGVTRIGFSSKSQREKNERKEAEKERKEHEKKMEEQTRRRKEFLMRDEIERNARAEAEREAREKERKDRDEQRKKERDMQEEAAKEENENNASSIAAQPFFCEHALVNIQLSNSSYVSLHKSRRVHKFDLAFF